MIKRILTLFSAVILLGLFFIPSGCVKEDFDTTPPLENIATWKKTVTISQLTALYASKAGIVKNLANDDFWNAILAQDVADSSIVIEGYVISSDSAANFYESVTIMDETGGIELKINDAELYLVYGLKPGQKVLIRVNDLALDNYNNVYQLGLAITDIYSGQNVIKVSKIASINVSKYIQLSGRKEKLEPIKVKINEITDALVSKLITIDSVQFRNPFLTYCIPGESNTNRFIIDKNYNKLILRSSGYAKFANTVVSSGSGTIVGVLSKYKTDYQLYIRDLNDVSFVNAPLFDIPTPNKTIAELKALYTSGTIEVTQDFVVEGVVVGNDVSDNLYKQLFVADESAGIEIRIDVEDLFMSYPLGAKVIVNCKGLFLGNYGGFIQLGGSSSGRLSLLEFNSKVFASGSESVMPVETTIDGITDNMLGKLIKLNSVQFIDADLTKIYAESSSNFTNRTLEDASNKTITVRTSKFADFASLVLPNKSGSITAVLSKYNSTYQLFIVKIDDVVFNQPRF